jgi:hypothetical protein
MTNAAYTGVVQRQFAFEGKIMKTRPNRTKRSRSPLSNIVSAGFVVAFLILGSAASHAAQPGSLAGLGNLPCSSVMEFIKQDPAKEDAFFNWLEGYLSGSNVVLRLNKMPMRDVASFSPDQHRQYVRGWCNLHPTDKYVIAAYQLFSALAFMPNE